MSKSPDEIFNEAVEKHADVYSLGSYDSCHKVDFKAGTKWLKENPHLIPSVKGLIDAAKRIRPSHSVNHYDCDDDPICEKSCSACAFHKVLKAFDYMYFEEAEGSK